jgi:hypothetical protein
MKLLSIDVGMKNLAFCLFDVTNSKNFLVTKWDVVDICQEKKYKCSHNEKGKDCFADAKFFKDDKYYCKKHATKQDLKVPPNTHDISKLKKLKIKEIIEFADNNEIEYQKPHTKENILKSINDHLNINYFTSIKPIKTDDIDLITLGRNLKTVFDSIFAGDFIDLEKVIIENQISPLANRMKTLQGMISQYFIMRSNCTIEYISSQNKLKDIEPNKTTYNERKKIGIEYCKTCVNEDNMLVSWKDTFMKHSKKDDLADSFLQGIFYIKKFHN